MTEPSNRRPLASRDTRWAANAASRLAQTRITPNQISMIGMVSALLAFLCFWAAGGAMGAGRVLLLILAAAFVQGRLLCNLLDGMVAIEAGKRAPDGGFWNEFPDRISDALILVGVGMATGHLALAWAATAFSFLTAYIRELGVNCGEAADFSGPMAKQHRMAVVTAAAVLTVFVPLFGWRDELLVAALWIIVIGAMVTALSRAWRLVTALRRKG